MAIYILGTKHELQHTGQPFRAAPDKVKRGRCDLQIYLRELVTKYHVTLIAEEFSQQVLDIKDAASTAKSVADELGIEHLFCDPDSTVRTEIGLPAGGTEDYEPVDKERYNRIRETYWLNCLANVLDRDILFICGSDHVYSFCERLSNNCITVTVICVFFGREIYEA